MGVFKQEKGLHGEISEKKAQNPPAKVTRLWIEQRFGLYASLASELLIISSDPNAYPKCLREFFLKKLYTQ